MRAFLFPVTLSLLASCAWMRPKPPEYENLLSESGVIMRDLVVPERGEQVRQGDTVAIHYELWVQDGPLVESSRDQGTAVRFEVGAAEVPRGLEEGVLGMRLFGRRRIVVPSELAYGAEGRPPLIPPDATLVFDVELMEHQVSSAAPQEQAR
jgi:peptidylprolyl isomerase